MPNDVLTTMAKETGKNPGDLERYWSDGQQDAMKAGKREGDADYYAHVMGIVRQRAGITEEVGTASDLGAIPTSGFGKDEDEEEEDEQMSNLLTVQEEKSVSQLQEAVDSLVEDFIEDHRVIDASKILGIPQVVKQLFETLKTRFEQELDESAASALLVFDDLIDDLDTSKKRDKQKDNKEMLKPEDFEDALDDAGKEKAKEVKKAAKENAKEGEEMGLGVLGYVEADESLKSFRENKERAFWKEQSTKSMASRLLDRLDDKGR